MTGLAVEIFIFFISVLARGARTGIACQLDTIWSALQESRAKRRRGVVASADLLPLDAYVIPEKRAPQLGAPKMSPSVQLGAVDIMSRRERDSHLGTGDATAVRLAYSRNFLMKHAGIDQGQHLSWQYDLMS